MQEVPVKSWGARSKKHHAFCWGVKHMSDLHVASLLENWKYPTGNVQIPSSPGPCWINILSCICACIETAGLSKRSLSMKFNPRQQPGSPANADEVLRLVPCCCKSQS